MWSMSGRPCNPDSDLQRLWRIFLRATPMPQCAPQDRRDATDGAGAASEPTLPTKSEPATKSANDR